MSARHLVVVGTLGSIAAFATACGGVLPAQKAASNGAHVVATAARPATAATSPATPSTSAAATVDTPPPAAQVVVVESNNLDSMGNRTIEVLSTTGHVVATATVSGSYQWTVVAAHGAAWWLDGSHLIKYDASGAHAMTTVPSTTNSLVVSPDGTQWVYTTATTPDANNVSVNAMYHGGVGLPTTQLVSRRSDPATGGTWMYGLGPWTSRGVVAEHWPTGGCGCGSAFDMEMMDVAPVLVDPATGATTILPMSSACPLSGIDDSALSACFAPNGNGGDGKVEFVDTTRVEHSYALSGTTLGGAATFNGSTVAYATVPDGDSGCGGPDWHVNATLRLMDVSTGAAHAIGHLGLVPSAWLQNGTLLAQSYHSDASGNTVSTVVDVNPATGATTTIAAGDYFVVGIA